MFCNLCSFHAICHLMIFFSKSSLKFSKISFRNTINVSRTVWIKIRPNILLGLIWVQTVCKGYQQTTKVDNEDGVVFGEGECGCDGDCKNSNGYDQGIPQSQTAEKPLAPWGRDTQQSRDIRKTNEALFPIKMMDIK